MIPSGQAHFFSTSISSSKFVSPRFSRMSLLQIVTYSYGTMMTSQLSGIFASAVQLFDSSIAFGNFLEIWRKQLLLPRVRDTTEGISSHAHTTISYSVLK